MKNPDNSDSKKLGQWLAYLWTTLVEEVEQCGLKHQPATILPAKAPFMAYKLPAHDPATFEEFCESEALSGFDGMEIDSEFFTMEIHSAGEEMAKESLWGEDVELLDRPYIYN